MELKHMISASQYTKDDEIFRLSFELKALSDLLVRSEAERWVPGFMWSLTEQEHVNRYKFARDYVAGKSVIDVACGCGYGSYILAAEGKASFVWAGDIDAQSIRYGQIKYPHPNVSRHVSDASLLTFSNEFDVAVSFETIEHVDKPETFLNNVYSALKNGGLFMISTPIARQTTRKPHNPHHRIEWSYDDFHALLAAKFSIEKVLVQSVEYTTNKWRSRVKRLFNVSSHVAVDPSLMVPKGNLRLNKILRGYQVLVCKKV